MDDVSDDGDNINNCSETQIGSAARRMEQFEKDAHENQQQGDDAENDDPCGQKSVFPEVMSENEQEDDGKQRSCRERQDSARPMIRSKNKADD